MRTDTIFALASGAGRAGIAVIRISGPVAGDALKSLSGRNLPPSRQANLIALKDKGVELDRALVLWFPGPKSFTGEDVVELHLHGGRAVIQGVIRVLAAIEGLRPAEAGEFSRRAFENGRMDLTEVEGLADLINAETEAQRRQALHQMEGVLGTVYENWRQGMIAALAYAEAGIDFSDEDLPKGIEEDAKEKVRIFDEEIENHLQDGHRGEMLRDGLRVTILGPPNAGKSSLLNAIAQRDAAIVSDRAGTTRDVVEVHLDLGGYPAILADTAGLRETEEDIEAEGIRRALDYSQKADLKIIVLDGGLWPQVDEITRQQIDENAILVLNKADLLKDRDLDQKLDGKVPFRLSAKNNEGLRPLFSEIQAFMEEKCPVGGAPALTRERHRLALEECRDHIARYLQNNDTVLGAEDLRLAVRALGKITGRVDVEDLLDVIFRDFCIGK